MKHTVRYWHKVAALLGSCLVAAGLGLSLPSQAQSSDSLYVGDAGDNTVKRFDAASGSFQGPLVKHSLAGLHGPMGLVFDAGGNLLVSDQNVDTSAKGDILQYSASGRLLNRVVPHSDPDAPVAPRGMVLWQNHLFVAEFSTESVQNRLPSPGRLLKYTQGGLLVGAYTPQTLSRGEFHPRGLVVGPDGKLYVSNYPDLLRPTVPGTGLGGQVLRFDPTTGAFTEFIASTGGATCACVNELNRPEGLVFGPDGRLYITSFRASVNDTDKIVVFQGPAGPNPGAYVDRIDLDAAGVDSPRAFAQALLFGPAGKLFVPISGGSQDTIGSVRRYEVSTKSFDLFVTPGGALKAPWYLSFGKTHSASLAYNP